MKPFEYLLLLPAVLLGLALSDIALSTHRLLSIGRRVKWDWLAPLAAMLAFAKILTRWWAWFGGEQVARGLTFEMFAGVLLSAGVLFLLAATSLPDDVTEQGVDLRAHYANVSRRYWVLFLLHYFAANAIIFWAQARVGQAQVSLSPPLFAIPVLALVLSIVRNRWLSYSIACISSRLVSLAGIWPLIGCITSYCGATDRWANGNRPARWGQRTSSSFIGSPRFPVGSAVDGSGNLVMGSEVVAPTTLVNEAKTTDAAAILRCMADLQSKVCDL